MITITNRDGKSREYDGHVSQSSHDGKIRVIIDSDEAEAIFEWIVDECVDMLLITFDGLVVSVQEFKVYRQHNSDVVRIEA